MEIVERKYKMALETIANLLDNSFEQDARRQAAEEENKRLKEQLEKAETKQ